MRIRTRISMLTNRLMVSLMVPENLGKSCDNPQAAAIEDVLRTTDSIYVSTLVFDSATKIPTDWGVALRSQESHLRPDSSAASDGRSSRASCISLFSSNGCRDCIYLPLCSLSLTCLRILHFLGTRSFPRCLQLSKPHIPMGKHN